MVIWTDRDALEETYPDAQDVIESSFSFTDYQYNDRPETAFWTDTTRTRVRLVQCDWVERGVWWRATYTKSGLLAAPERSKFKDRKGKSTSGLILQSSFINRENQRYGAVRGLIGMQDEINKAPLQGAASVVRAPGDRRAGRGAGCGQGTSRSGQAGRLHRASDTRPEVRDRAERRPRHRAVPVAAARHRRDAAIRPQCGDERHRLSGTMSGRAILAQQAGGAAQNEPLASTRCGIGRGRVCESCWMTAAREYWTGGKWVRVTDDLRRAAVGPAMLTGRCG